MTPTPPADRAAGLPVRRVAHTPLGDFDVPAFHASVRLIDGNESHWRWFRAFDIRRITYTFNTGREVIVEAEYR